MNNKFLSLYFTISTIIYLSTVSLEAMEEIQNNIPYNLSEIYRSIHQCSCLKRFRNLSKFISHIKRGHKSDNGIGFKCFFENCKFEVPSPEFLLLHFPLHTDEIIQVCSICYFNIKNIHNHSNLHRDFPKAFEYLVFTKHKLIPDCNGYFKCANCKTNFKQVRQFLEHVNSNYISSNDDRSDYPHSYELIKITPKEISSFAPLKLTFIDESNNEQTHKYDDTEDYISDDVRINLSQVCRYINECPSHGNFIDNRTILEHIKNHHKSPNGFSCPTCLIERSSPELLLLHFPHHTGRIELCCLCYYKFGDYWNTHKTLHQRFKRVFEYLAKTNYKMIPGFVGNFNCPICPQSFKYIQNLLKHIKTNHENDIQLYDINSKQMPRTIDIIVITPEQISTCITLKYFSILESSLLEMENLDLPKEPLFHVDEISGNNIPSSTANQYISEADQSQFEQNEQTITSDFHHIYTDEIIDVCNICLCVIEDLSQHNKFHEYFEKAFGYLIKHNYKMLRDSYGCFNCPTCEAKIKDPFIFLTHIQGWHIVENNEYYLSRSDDLIRKPQSIKVARNDLSLLFNI